MSKEQKDRLEGLTRKYWPVLVLTVIAVGLIIGSFFVPPYGTIDGSVLTASGELFAFAALVVFIVRAESGADVTVRKGDIEVVIDNPETKGEE